MVKGSFDRQQFLTWLGEGAPSRMLSESGVMPTGDKVLVLRATGPDRDRPLIVVRDSNALQDFFAFVSTYVSTYVPFSSFFRVITFQEWEGLSKHKELLVGRLPRAVVGAIICDAISSSRSGAIDGLSLRDCLTSESFSIGKALVSGQLIDLQEVARRRASCLKLISGQSAPFSDVNFEFWRSLDVALKSKRQASSGMERSLSIAIVELLNHGDFSQRMWSELDKLHPALSDVRLQMAGPREIRARIFTNFIRSDALASSGPRADIIVGFLGAMLAGGQLEYAQLISGLRVAFPNAPRWFGFICGCLDYSDVLASGRSFGRHVLKEMAKMEELGEEISADVSFEELMLVGSSKGGLASIRSKSIDLLNVELLPGLAVAVPFPMAGDQGRDAPLREKTDDRIEEARRLARRISVLLSTDGRDDDMFNGSNYSGRRTTKK